MIDWSPIWLTTKLAVITTAILFVISIPISYWLANSKSRLKIIAEASISLPFVLPPSVLGFYLLIAFSPASGFGKFIEEYFNIRLVFSFSGLIVASILYSMPFMINPILSGLKNVPISLQEAAFTLGKSKTTTLLKVLLPNIRPALLTGIVMTFAHTIGEFGVVLMIGGSIPNETKVVSIAVYDEVQAMNYHHANVYAGVLFAFTFLILLGVYWINSKNKNTNLL